MKKSIILIAGMPASGKTTLLNILTKDIFKAFPISVDLIQELLYDTLGFNSVQERRQIKKAAFSIAIGMAQTALKNGLVPILEYPFGNTHKDQLLKSFNETTFITVRLDLPIESAYERFHKRDLSDKRHPGHFYNQYPIAEGAVPSYQEFDKYKEAMLTSQVCEFSLGKTLAVNADLFPLPIKHILSYVNMCLSEHTNEGENNRFKHSTTDTRSL